MAIDSTPLILRGNLQLDGQDVSSSITSFKITANRAVVTIPATLGTAESSRAGAASYAIELGYFSTDSDEIDTVFAIMWSAITDDADGQVDFSGSMRDGAINDANPAWSGTFICTGTSVGGDAEALSTYSGTYPLIAAPHRDGNT